MTRQSRGDPSKGPSGGGGGGGGGPPGPVPGPIEEGGFKRVSTQFAHLFVKAVLPCFLIRAFNMLRADLCRGCSIYWVDSAYNGSVFFAMELNISADFTCK